MVNSILKLMFYVLIFSSALAVYSYQKKRVLPSKEFINSQLDQDPIQTPTSERPFKFDYKGTNYLVEPVADYQLWGLVVSQNDTLEFCNFYHDDTSVDIKDLCVVWGKNVKSEIYKQMEFWSEPWTCWTKAETKELYSRFSEDQLSNNHLLSSKESARDTIWEASIGDQIYIEGKLVNYTSPKTPGFMRKSSTIRTDKGDGACEVLFVENMRIINKANIGWHKIFNFSKGLSVLILILYPIIFVGGTLIEFRLIYGDVKPAPMTKLSPHPKYQTKTPEPPTE
jgi:hypothetical protein